MIYDNHCELDSFENQDVAAVLTHHGEELLWQGVVGREELEGVGGRQGGGGLLVVVVVMVVAVAEAAAHRQLLAQELHLVLDPLQGLREANKHMLCKSA